MATGPEAVAAQQSAEPPFPDDVDIEGDERLVGLLARLIREHGRQEAAAVIGIGYKTLQRSLAARQLSERLRLALERHLYLQAGADVPDSPLVGRLDALEERVGDIEEQARSQAEALATLEALGQRLSRLEESRSQVELVERISVDVGKLRSELHRQVASVEQAVGSLAARVSELSEKAATSAGTPVRQQVGGVAIEAHTDAAAGAAEPAEVVEVDPLSDVAGGRKGALLEEWEAARAIEAGAQTGLERARAAEQRLALELEVIRDHRESIPPGELWAPAKRSRELEWRWEALEDRRRVRRRYEIRRFVRRVLTLSLWRS